MHDLVLHGRVRLRAQLPGAGVLPATIVDGRMYGRELFIGGGGGGRDSPPKFIVPDKPVPLSPDVPRPAGFITVWPPDGRGVVEALHLGAVAGRVTGERGAAPPPTCRGCGYARTPSGTGALLLGEVEEIVEVEFPPGG